MAERPSLAPVSLGFGDLIKARFLERPNRFLVRCAHGDGLEINAYLPNPGRLWELLLPGAPLYLKREDGLSRRGAAQRKTHYTVLAVERQGYPVFLHTHATNMAARYLIEAGSIPHLRGAGIVKAEVSAGRSRFDFLLRQKGRQVYVEVKSCTLFGNGVAMFPDAVTERGSKHLRELADIGRSGGRSVVLFLVHFPLVKWFMPDYHTDYVFSTTMLDVRKDVTILPVAVEWNKDLSLARSVKVLDVPWTYLDREVKDRGSYLLLLELARDKVVDVGSLKRISFSKGYHIYVGSAMNGLNARIARHRRKNKKPRWHIDYLTRVADGIHSIPIRFSVRMECQIARAMSSLFKPGPRGFGASDCECLTHLWSSGENPLHSEAFHRVLQGFRMRNPETRMNRKP